MRVLVSSVEGSDGDKSRKEEIEKVEDGEQKKVERQTVSFIQLFLVDPSTVFVMKITVQNS